MPTQTTWLIANHLIFSEFMNEISIEELASATDTIVEMIDSCDTILVHTLIDATTLTKYPQNIINLRKASQDSFSHPRFGWLVIYGAQDQLSMFFVNIVTSFFKVRLKMVDTREEAIGFLKNIEQALPPNLS